jgi:hypothetical protein
MNIRRSMKLLAIPLLAAASTALASHGHGHTQKLNSVARLFGDDSMKGTVKFEERSRHNSTTQRLRVQVVRAEANQDYPVMVNDVQIGVIHTNHGGVGRIDLRSSQHGHSAHHGTLPEGFTTLSTGDMISVGNATGMFFDTHDHSMQKVEVEGALTGSDTLSGEVKYSERFRDGHLTRCFKVELQGAAPGESFDVFVNDQLVGTLVADENGEAELKLITGEPNDGEDDNVMPMPDSFPTLHDGDVVNVGGLSATLSSDDQGDNGGQAGGDDGDDDGQGGDDGSGSGDGDDDGGGDD